MILARVKSQQQWLAQGFASPAPQSQDMGGALLRLKSNGCFGRVFSPNAPPLPNLIHGGLSWSMGMSSLKGRILQKRQLSRALLPGTQAQLRWEKAANQRRSLVLWIVLEACCEALWTKLACLPAPLSLLFIPFRA